MPEARIGAGATGPVSSTVARLPNSDLTQSVFTETRAAPSTFLGVLNRAFAKPSVYKPAAPTPVMPAPVAAPPPVAPTPVMPAPVAAPPPVAPTPVMPAPVAAPPPVAPPRQPSPVAPIGRIETIPPVAPTPPFTSMGGIATPVGIAGMGGTPPFTSMGGIATPVGIAGMGGTPPSDPINFKNGPHIAPGGVPPTPKPPDVSGLPPEGSVPQDFIAAPPRVSPRATGFVLGGRQAMDAIDRADASGQTPMKAPPPAQSRFDPNSLKIDPFGNLVKSAPGDMSQEALIRQLQAAAAGIGGQGSLAQQQLQAAGARAQGQAFGGSQGVREVGFGARARTGTDAMGQISGDMSSQSAILGLQEQQAARAQLAEALQAQRQQDLTQQTQGTQFQQDLGQFGDAFENAQTKNSYDQAIFNQDIMNQLADAAQAKKIMDLNLQSAQSDRIAGGIGGLAATAGSMASSGKNYSATQNTPNQGTGGPYDNTAKSNPNEWNPWPK